MTNVSPVAQTINITAAGIDGDGTLSLLHARSLNATTETTLAGQRLSPQTGQLAGTPHLTPVHPTAVGVYAIQVPADTAAILDLPSKQTS